MEDPGVAQFSLILRDPPSTSAESAEFVDLRAAIDCRGFAGQTHFSTARRDVDSFISDVVLLQQSKCHAAQFLAGWDDAEERLRLRLTPAGRSGQFIARVKIATTGPRTDQWQRVETEFVCSPTDVSAFVRSLEQLVEHGQPGTAVLAGNPEEIA